MAFKKVVLGLLLASISLFATQMTVYKSKFCGCCDKWVEHMEENGYKAKTITTEDMTTIKKELGVPLKLQSCHTVVIGDYIVEGHVPADVVTKMLKEKPNFLGIASPGMPIGSPGMEHLFMKEDNPIFGFTKDGESKLYEKR